ncbi:MAG: hypothetical protein QOE68_917 [Thermoanaerobaculia bacterium]|jgi:hypothetical protein|nr:hypothetical protein [Thermoanaerobaculia bacterium]
MKVLSFAAFALFVASSANAAGITGTVTNDTGAPLAGMTVSAYRTDDGTLGATGTTSTSGTYSLTLFGGQYRVVAFDPTGFYAASFYADAESFETSTKILLTSILTQSNINFRLVRAGFAVGRVTAPGGAALQNMTVAAYNPSGTRRGFTNTDAAGNFVLALPPGSYRIAAYDEAFAYATTFFPAAASFESAAAVSIATGASAVTNLQLPVAAKIIGTVTDRATIAPIADARVTVYTNDGSVAGQASTRADGNYSVAVRPGGLRVVIDDPAGTYAATYVPDAESFSTESIVAAAAGQTVTVNATLVRAGHLAGHIKDAGSGTALAGITAAAYNADGTIRAFAITDASGAYSIVVPAGDYRLGTFDASLVYLPSFYASQSSFAGATIVHANADQNAAGFDFPLTKGARISGHVTSRISGAPLGVISVGAYDLGGRLLASTTTDLAGTYTLLLQPATVKLLAFDAALQFATAYYLDAATFDATQALALAEGQALTADFAMSEGGRISGVVIAGSTFAPLPNLRVIIYDATFRTIAEAVTDSGGAFRVVVPPGAYLIAAADPAHHYDPLFYGGGGGTIVNVSARQDVGPLQFRLVASVVPLRRRAVTR